jgi:hypothetical protein
VVVGAVLAGVAVAVAAVIRRRVEPPAPTRTGYAVPSQLHRADFVRPDAPWLVVVFSSDTCLACVGTWEKARQLESPSVATQDVEVSAHKDLHDRYEIDAVPCLVVADADGVVRASFIGEPTATDLWAAVAELREPGSTPEACDHHQSAP